MEKQLNKKRLLLVIIGLTIIFSVPTYWYLTTQVEMKTLIEVMFSYAVTLFIGVCFAGVFLYGVIFFLGGTLPKWFWVAESAQIASIVQQCEAFLRNPRTLVALTVIMIPVTIAATNVYLGIFDFVMMSSFAYRATDALITEFKK